MCLNCKPRLPPRLNRESNERTNGAYTAPTVHGVGKRAELGRRDERSEADPRPPRAPASARRLHVASAPARAAAAAAPRSSFIAVPVDGLTLAERGDDVRGPFAPRGRAKAPGAGRLRATARRERGPASGVCVRSVASRVAVGRALLPVPHSSRLVASRVYTRLSPDSRRCTVKLKGRVGPSV